MEEERCVGPQLHHANDHNGDEAKFVHSRPECNSDVDKAKPSLSITHGRIFTPSFAVILRLHVHCWYHSYLFRI